MSSAKRKKKSSQQRQQHPTAATPEEQQENNNRDQDVAASSTRHRANYIDVSIRTGSLWQRMIPAKPTHPGQKTFWTILNESQNDKMRRYFYVITALNFTLPVFVFYLVRDVLLVEWDADERVNYAAASALGAVWVFLMLFLWSARREDDDDDGNGDLANQEKNKND